MIPKDLTTIINQEDEQARAIRNLKRVAVGGSILLSIAILGMKVDNIRNYSLLNRRIDDNHEAYVQETTRRLEAYEERLQRTEGNIIIIQEPCLTPRADNVYEVNACSN